MDILYLVLTMGISIAHCYCTIVLVTAFISFGL